MEETLKLMQSLKRWPNWPVLPLKREVDTGLEYGFLAASPGQLTTVFLGSPANLPGRMIGVPPRFRSIEYKSFEEIIKDGWLIV